MSTKKRPPRVSTEDALGGLLSLQGSYDEHDASDNTDDDQHR
jgi:hypothetical protein